MENTVKKEITNFSIWDSVVVNKIVMIENLEKKCRDRGRQIEELETENGDLKEQLSVQNKDASELQAKNKEYEEQISALMKEQVSLKTTLANMEDSTCWKITRPVRAVLDHMRRM